MISTRNAGIFQCRSLFSPSRLVSSKKEVKISNKRTWIEHVADVRSPHLWYPAARALTPRVITCHVGPTNSGKTYAALQALKRSRTGIYCGPLRLLAWEVTEILRNSEFGDSGDSIACSLITGQEKDIAPGATHVSCTVEMTNLGDDFDCAVIDEMQLIGDRERGWAWTQALLGLRCRNIHVCGNATFLPLLRQICADTGDELVVHEYQRMSPLTPATVALGSYSDIAPGDCVIGFSRSKLYQIKASVERELNRNVLKHYRKNGDCGSSSSPPIETKCCVIYGNLPPDTRRNQAALFNNHNVESVSISKTSPKQRGGGKGARPEPTNSVLVATDAIGMGLNLSIRRIIFSSMMKFDGTEHRDLYPTEVKQIAGRAGRFGEGYGEGGVVAVYHERDVDYLHECLAAPDEDILTAGILPTLDHLELLHLLVAYNVTQAQLDAFYDSQIAAAVGAGSGEFERESKDVAAATTGKLFHHFGSVRRLVQVLDSYLQDIYFRLDMLDDALVSSSASIPEPFKPDIVNISGNGNGNGKVKGKRARKQLLPRENVLFSELLNLYRQSQRARDRGEEDASSGVGRKSEGRRRLDVSTTGSQLTMDAEDDSDAGADATIADKYSICELDEMIQISQLLDQFTSDELAIKERYQWCLAPINLDNSLLLSLFPTWAEEFVDTNEVQLHISSKSLNRYHTPDTPEALLQLEKLHQSLEVYIWLGHRFGVDVFIHMEEALQFCTECRKLIEMGLELVGKTQSQDGRRSFSGKGGKIDARRPRGASSRR